MYMAVFLCCLSGYYAAGGVSWSRSGRKADDAFGQIGGCRRGRIGASLHMRGDAMARKRFDVRTRGGKLFAAREQVEHFRIEAVAAMGGQPVQR
jgi:hypothetical protein